VLFGPDDLVPADPQQQEDISQLADVAEDMDESFKAVKEDINALDEADQLLAGIMDDQQNDED
jgi:hypothetical protein